MLSTKRKGIQSDRYIKKKRKKAIWLAVLIAVAFLSIFIALVFLSRANFLQFKTINIVSGSTMTVGGTATTSPLITSPQKITDLIQADLSKHLLYFFSRNNEFLYSDNTIRADLLEAFPRVHSVDIDASGLSTLNVTVSERAPFALACTAGAGADTCSYMDSTGYVYAPAPQFSSGVYIKYFLNHAIASSSLSTSTAGSVAVGSTIAPSDQLAIAEQATAYFSKMGLTVTKFFFDANNGYEVALRNGATTTSTIYFDMSAPLDTTLNYFTRFWQSRKDTDYDYIDLRYGQDIVFKMRADDPAVQGTSTTQQTQ